MNKSLMFKILYYFCFVFTAVIWVYASNLVDTFGIVIRTTMNTILILVNLTLVGIFSIKLIKNKLEQTNIIFPVVYLVFVVIVVILAYIMNNKLIIPYIHYGYYVSFILFNYLLLNIYSVLSFIKKK